MNKKYYFLSDVHLGSVSHPSSIDTERKLCRWLDVVKQDAAAIFLLGDIFDYWFEYKYVVPKGFTRLLGKLAEVTDSGVEVHFFIGNHDIWLTDYLAKECGLILHLEPLTINLLGEKFFLAHGDGLGDESWSFHLLRKMFHSKFLKKCFSGIHPRWTIPLAHVWSNSSRESGGVQGYLGEDREYLIHYAKQKLNSAPDINYFVFGHRHLLLKLAIAEQSQVVMLGDWLTLFSYAVFDGETMKLDQFEV